MKKTKNAFVFALQGMKHVFINERNFRIEIVCAVAVCITSYAVHISKIEWFVIIINIGFVLSAELVNSAIEKLCDVITTQLNPTIKIIKDVAAAAVLLAAVVAFICALVIFVPSFLKIITQ